MYNVYNKEITGFPRVILTLCYLIDPVLFVRLKYLYKTVMFYLSRFRLHSRPQLS